MALDGQPSALTDRRQGEMGHGVKMEHATLLYIISCLSHSPPSSSLISWESDGPTPLVKTNQWGGLAVGCFGWSNMCALFLCK